MASSLLMPPRKIPAFGPRLRVHVGQQSVRADDLAVPDLGFWKICELDFAEGFAMKVEEIRSFIASATGTK